MSAGELKRVEIMARVKANELKLSDAAEMLDMSYRQAKRIWRKYRTRGPDALTHGNAGRRSNRAKPCKFRQQVLRLVRKKYSGDTETRFGPTLTAEHLLSEDGLQIDAETLRRWMLDERLWSPERNSRQHRKRRERKGHFGELVQMDGSFHAWLEDRGPGG
jgi:transposase